MQKYIGACEDMGKILLAGMLLVLACGDSSNNSAVKIELPKEVSLGQGFEIKITSVKYKERRFTLSLEKCASSEIELLTASYEKETLTGTFSKDKPTSVQAIIIDNTGTRDSDTNKTKSCQLVVSVLGENGQRDADIKPVAKDIVFAKKSMALGVKSRAEGTITLTFDAGSLQGVSNFSYKRCTTTCAAAVKKSIDTLDNRATTLDVGVELEEGDNAYYVITVGDHTVVVRTGAVNTSNNNMPPPESGGTTPPSGGTTPPQTSAEVTWSDYPAIGYGKELTTTIQSSTHDGKNLEIKLVDCASTDVIIIPSEILTTSSNSLSGKSLKLTGTISSGTLKLSGVVYHIKGKRSPVTADVAGCNLQLLITNSDGTNAFQQKKAATFDMAARMPVGITNHRVYTTNDNKSRLDIDLQFDAGALSSLASSRVYSNACAVSTGGALSDCTLVSQVVTPPNNSATTLAVTDIVRYSNHNFFLISAGAHQFIIK